MSVFSKNLLAISLALAVLTLPSEAHADHTGGAIAQAIAILGGASLSGVIGVVATVGTAVTYGERNADGWRVTSYIIGTINLVWAGVWFVGARDEPPGLYGVGTAHLVLGGTTIGLAIGSSASIDDEVPTPSFKVISDSGGQRVPVWGVVGRF